MLYFIILLDTGGLTLKKFIFSSLVAFVMAFGVVSNTYAATYNYDLSVPRFGEWSCTGNVNLNGPSLSLYVTKAGKASDGWRSVVENRNYDNISDYWGFSTVPVSHKFSLTNSTGAAHVCFQYYPLSPVNNTIAGYFYY
jgi:hypothetical protein